MAENEENKLLITDGEKELSYYLDYLQNLETQKSDEIFSNEGDAHASILMGKLLEGTQKSLLMYCCGLRPGILCGKDEQQDKKNGGGYRGSYWKVFKKFFTDDEIYNKKVKILIQTKEYTNNLPFKIVKDSLKKNNNIEVKKIDDKWKNFIDIFLDAIVPPNIYEYNKQRNLGSGKSKYNFSVFDKERFRLEYDIDSYKAIGSFNSKSWCDILTALFDKAFEDAEPVNFQ
jgi:hypothetical protein